MELGITRTDEVKMIRRLTISTAKYLLGKTFAAAEEGEVTILTTRKKLPWTRAHL